MKRLLSAAAMLLTFGVSAGDYTAGKHYIELGDSGFKAPNSVVKVYSTNCPFCYKYEKAVMPSFIKNLPEGVEYDSFHITTKPPLGKEKASVIAVAKTTSEAAYKKVKMAYYANFHDEHKKFADGEEAISFGLKAAGISRADYDSKINTKELKDILAKWDQGLPVAKVKGIPAIVVNGQYLIVTGAVTSMKMLDDLTAELLAK